MNLTYDSNLARKKLEKYSYQLNSQIGKGYSSQVFKGRNDISNQSVAIKVIDLKMIKGEVHKNLLASEIQVLNTLKNSENIIEVFDIYTTKNNTYIITELCEGGDLSKIISNKNSLPENEARQLMNQIINGYNHISNRGIIHRDLKPANIFLKDKQIKIADFGFALRAFDAKKYSSYNVGSPIYMPPEALNDNKYSFKSDIWALGVIYYQMLTGKTPWRAKTEKQLGRQLLSVPIQKIIPKNLSNSSVQFLTKTLNMNINERMSPEQLSRFSFTSEKTDKQSTRHDLESTHSISDTRSYLTKLNNRSETSLTRNTINTPKYLKRVNMFKGSQDQKNVSLTKINNATFKTEFSISSSAKNIQTPSSVFSSTQKDAFNFRQSNNAAITDKKIISKQLLCQIHFCRFVYKLLKRIGSKLSTAINSQMQNLKQEMCGLVLYRLESLQKLKILSSIESSQYKVAMDYRKIVQIVHQYQHKYMEDLKLIKPGFISYQSLRQALTYQILNLHRVVDAKNAVDVKQEVIVLDYLITLRQLLYLLQEENLHSFYSKSKIEQIVEGAPSQHITKQHISAISNKLKSLKIL